uniref:Uncharacterized protein n=2 Tax=Canis lupus familiaris TaxID=9615 RepID=A0A8C0TPJ5_CANLF
MFILNILSLIIPILLTRGSLTLGEQKVLGYTQLRKATNTVGPLWSSTTQLRPRKTSHQTALTTLNILYVYIHFSTHSSPNTSYWPTVEF